MGMVCEHTVGIGTVGALIRALEKFPSDMPISVNGSELAEVFLVTPEDDEVFDDERGEVCIGEDGWLNEDVD